MEENRLFTSLRQASPMLSVIAYLVLANAVAFAVFIYDKRQARRGGYRISESSLLFLSLLGGGLGAFTAMQVARHKTSKLAFRIPFQATVAFQVAALSAITFFPHQTVSTVGALWG